MKIGEQVAMAMYYQGVTSGFKWENENEWFRDRYLNRADQIIPLILRAISKETTKLDHTTYRVPDYGKFKALWEEFAGKEGDSNGR